MTFNFISYIFLIYFHFGVVILNLIFRFENRNNLKFRNYGLSIKSIISSKRRKNESNIQLHSR